MLIGTPRRDSVNPETHLYFGRSLGATGDKPSGMAIIEIDAAYFVSGYEEARLGKHGVLGIIGNDGIFLVRRSGETVTTNDSSHYRLLALHAEDEAFSETTLQANGWDDVRRYTSAGQVYGFPLTVIVGLSADEQLAGAERSKRAYLSRAAAASDGAHEPSAWVEPPARRRRAYCSCNGCRIHCLSRRPHGAAKSQPVQQAAEP
jgi:hypothetical protein